MYCLLCVVRHVLFNTCGVSFEVWCSLVCVVVVIIVVGVVVAVAVD